MFEFFFSPNIYNHSNWVADLVVALFGTAVGAGLGFLGALQIQKRQSYGDSKLKIKLFLSVSQDVEKLLRKQIVKFNELSAKSVSEPYDFHLIGRPASNDLQRLSEMLKGEIMTSFAVLIDKESEEMYRKYRISVDYLALTYEETFEMNRKNINFIFDDQCFIRDKVDEIIAKLMIRKEALTGIDSNPTNSEEKQYILSLDDERSRLFMENLENQNSNLDKYKTEFFEDIYLKGKHYLQSTVYDSILAPVQSALNRFEKIKFNNKQLSDDVNSYITGIEKQLEILSKLNVQLLNSLK